MEKRRWAEGEVQEVEGCAKWGGVDEWRCVSGLVDWIGAGNSDLGPWG